MLPMSSSQELYNRLDETLRALVRVKKLKHKTSHFSVSAFIVSIDQPLFTMSEIFPFFVPRAWSKVGMRESVAPQSWQGWSQR
jgi:hypothetical protein